MLQLSPSRRISAVLASVMIAAAACVDPGGPEPSDCTMFCNDPPDDYVPITFETKPTRVAGGLTFASLSVGPNHACGIVSGVGTYCWGERDSGVVGYRNAARPELTPGTSDIVRISSGDGFRCGLRQDGRALCWGRNIAGEIGNGVSGTPAWSPALVQGDLSFTAISTAGAALPTDVPHTCGLTASGAAYCWGFNRLGQLGDGGRASSPGPVAVAGGHVFETISIGDTFTCGVARGGAGYCWGVATDGRLGDAAENIGYCGPSDDVSFLRCSATPRPVTGGHTFTTVSAGRRHACGLDPDGVAYCWGVYPITGYVYGENYVWTSGPVRVAGSVRFTAIAAGTTATCGLTESREVFCWGANTYGELGDGTTTTRMEPTKVATDLPFVAIAVGYEEACALTPDGAAYCWGSNEHRKLGKGS